VLFLFHMLFPLQLCVQSHSEIFRRISVGYYDALHVNIMLALYSFICKSYMYRFCFIQFDSPDTSPFGYFIKALCNLLVLLLISRPTANIAVSSAKVAMVMLFPFGISCVYSK
jgi:hypothetical protein